MKHLLFQLIFLLSAVVSGQNWQNDATLLSHARVLSPEASGGSVHLMPFSLLNNPSRIRLGGQYKNKRFSYLLDLEYGTDKLRVVFDGDSDPDYRFLGFRPELRYQTKWSEDLIYLGFEVPVTIKHESHSGNLVDEEQNSFWAGEALERRVRVSGIAKIGWQMIVFHRVMLDAYLGGGLAYRHYRFSDIENPGPPREQPNEWGCCELKQHGGKFRGELALGLRMGYWFGNK
ncbi:hypothetical protein FUA23_09400 [Neolewinella aurantiaca]|uniref:DUF3575 domain-containing protein n=1 Tax=Neolewinella aurantiaca TaxID=2602767 RepID=A0A5C7FT62_9BACT|nr:hypothetical protein [Neolewinella aurantiaca]TXF89655.1 hypothetical protein FUA23_09400 [Neolewinella aurantiaca]